MMQHTSLQKYKIGDLHVLEMGKKAKTWH